MSGAAIKLTFDDGPDRRWTPRVLDRLARCDARATFFPIAERIPGAREQLRAAREAGHEIGLHCHRHIRHTELDEAAIAADTEAALETLDAVGVTPRYWRTPWGVATPASLAVAGRFGLELMGWSCDTHDWRGDSASAMLAAADPDLDQTREETIVLMHDGLGPGALRCDCQQTVALITPLVELARERGLRVSA